VFKHSTPYQVFGRLFPEKVEGLQPDQSLDEDTMLIAAEDESGYLQFFPPDGRWNVGTYRIDIHIGFQINPINRMGTMRFQVAPQSSPPLAE
jgi:hypothetical protein